MRFETRFTYDFIKRFLRSKCRRILEIGCGTGELAARLSKDGYSIVAIDSDRDSIGATARFGVDAHVATWPDFADGHFDAILFTRSIHHIEPLPESLSHALDSLAKNGRIIIEDFAYESADEKTLRWFTGAVRSLQAAGLLMGSGELLNNVLLKAETLEAWRQNHQGELHTAAEIAAQLEKLFGRIVKENAPYYFRYLANAIIDTEERDTILQTLAEEEEKLAANGSIIALGRRFVAWR
jgi:SAM-dependent methyltransferase